MLILIHGNDNLASRNYYFEEKNKTKNNIILNGDGLTYNDLFYKTQSNSLFEENATVFVENFFGKSKKNAQEYNLILDYLFLNKTLSVVFWENLEISKTVVNSLKNFTIKTFSYPQSLFLFLDNLKPNNASLLIKLFHELLKSTEPEIIFFMITRQFRLMLNASDGKNAKIDELKRLAPWQLSKITNQANIFGQEKLKSIFNELYNLDLRQKTGKNAIDLASGIDFFLAAL